jgi:pimeloyl-ACP methyl ester carboxylesterase
LWGSARHGRLWRSFLTEQRALVRELGGLTAALPEVVAPALLIADPRDTLVPLRTTHRLAAALPDARVRLVSGTGHHLPQLGAPAVAAAIVRFLAALDNRPASA